MATDFLTDKTIQALKARDKQFKVSDGKGMYLLVMPNGGKLWQMAYRFAGKQKTYSIGVYPDVTLNAARDKRNAARKQLAAGIDPHGAKMEKKEEQKKAQAIKQVAAKTFGLWADEWLGKERAGGNTEKTIAGKTNRVGLLKARYGAMPLADILRDDVLAFVREFELRGELETRDRTRANGESIFDYACSDDADNPFRPFKKGKLIKKKSAPRPAMTKPADVAKLFKALAVDRQDKGLDEVVSLALRFLSLTAVRPGELGSAEWRDFDLDAALWTIPAHKMKMRKEHCVPLSRQAVAILRRMQDLTGHGTIVFSCSRNAELANGTLNKRLRWHGFKTDSDHCAHGFRSTFSTLMNAECDRNDAKLWDSDLIELQLAHIEGGVAAIYNRVGALSLIGARAKMMQHWANRIDIMVEGGNVIALTA